MQVVRGREEKILKAQRSKPGAGEASGADDAINSTTASSTTTANNTNSTTAKVGKFEFNPAALKDESAGEGAKKRKLDDAASSGEEGASGKKKLGRGARQREKRRQAKVASESKEGPRVESWAHVQTGGMNSLNLNDNASLKNQAKNFQKGQKGQPPQKKPKTVQPQLTREQIKEKKKSLRENPFYFPPSAMKEEVCIECISCGSKRSFSVASFFLTN